jgi:hypothetical protein
VFEAVFLNVIYRINQLSSRLFIKNVDLLNQLNFQPDHS